MYMYVEVSSCHSVRQSKAIMSYIALSFPTTTEVTCTCIKHLAQVNIYARSCLYTKRYKDRDT